MAPKKNIMKQGLYFILAIFFSIVIAGCAEKVEVPKDDFYEKWRTLAETSQPSSPADTAVKTGLPQKDKEVILQAKEIDVQKPAPKVLPSVPVSMTMRDTDVNVILRSLARIADQNIMMNKEVGGVTNINVIEAPWDQVFLGILRTRGLVHTWEGDIIRIMTLADMERDGAIEEAYQAQQAQAFEGRQVEPLLTRVFPVNYADIEDLAENLNNVLTKTGETEKGYCFYNIGALG